MESIHLYLLLDQKSSRNKLPITTGLSRIRPPNPKIANFQVTLCCKESVDITTLCMDGGQIYQPHFLQNSSSFVHPFVGMLPLPPPKKGTIFFGWTRGGWDSGGWNLANFFQTSNVIRFPGARGSESWHSFNQKSTNRKAVAEFLRTKCSNGNVPSTLKSWRKSNGNIYINNLHGNNIWNYDIFLISSPSKKLHMSASQGIACLLQTCSPMLRRSCHIS